MQRQRLSDAQRATERFIEKRLRVNKPFQSLIASDRFEAFQSELQAAIKAQYKAVANVLKDSHLVALTTPDMVRQFVETNMPALSTHVAKDDVLEYLEFCFLEGVRAQYGRLGLKTKTTKMSFEFDGGFDFELTNPDLIAALEADADFLLNRSNIDATTRQRLIDLIQQTKLENNATIDEISKALTDEMPDISASRAFTIARTETSRAMGQGNFNAMVQNGVTTKKWVLAGSKPCEICQPNADDGYIPVNDTFSSGDDYEPAHPNCECYTEAGEINLDDIDVWDGS